MIHRPYPRPLLATFGVKEAPQTSSNCTSDVLFHTHVLSLMSQHCMFCTQMYVVEATTLPGPALHTKFRVHAGNFHNPYLNICIKCHEMGRHEQEKLSAHHYGLEKSISPPTHLPNNFLLDAPLSLKWQKPRLNIVLIKLKSLIRFHGFQNEARAAGACSLWSNGEEKSWNNTLRHWGGRVLLVLAVHLRAQRLLLAALSVFTHLWLCERLLNRY